MKYTTLTVYIPSEKKENLQLLAKELGISASSLVVRFLDNFHKFRIADAVCDDNNNKK